MKETELYWLAGLLEGEGTFLAPPPSEPRYPRVVLDMTDEEVVRRAALLMGAYKVQSKSYAAKSWKTSFQAVVKGSKAVALMKVLRPLLGKRRQAQIDRALLGV